MDLKLKVQQIAFLKNQQKLNQSNAISKDMKSMNIYILMMSFELLKNPTFAIFKQL